MKPYFFTVLILLMLVGCAQPPKPGPPSIVEPLQVFAPLRVASFGDLPFWRESTPAAALITFVNSCRALIKQEAWAEVCLVAGQIRVGDEQAARSYFETFFSPWQLINEDGSDSGTITGYYVPEMAGRRTPDATYKYPIYKQPEDLLTINLDSIYTELSNYRLRGRVEGTRVVPYFDRGEIDSELNPLAGNEIFYVADPVDLFFLHIQGSGRILLPGGEKVMINYANQNGHRYHSIGKLLLKRGALTRDQMSMQNIRRWVADHPAAGRKLLNENPSYVFFRELAAGVLSPPGALGIPLSAERSLAVDRRSIPLGAPVFIATSWPNSSRPLHRLMVAQDTGGAIKGRVRADFFWGMGVEAGQKAGRMKQQGMLWVLLPRTFQVDASGRSDYP